MSDMHYRNLYMYINFQQNRAHKFAKNRKLHKFANWKYEKSCHFVTADIHAKFWINRHIVLLYLPWSDRHGTKLIYAGFIDQIL